MGGSSRLVVLNTGATTLTSTATTQFTLAYDGSNNVLFQVSSGGDLTIDASGNDVNFASTDTVRVLGKFATNATDANSNFGIMSGSGGSGTTQAELQINGSGTVDTRIFERGSTSVTPAVNRSYGSHIIGTQVATRFTSGTHGLFTNFAVNPLTINTGVAALTNAATVFIGGAATGTGIPTNNYALWVSGGAVRLDGTIELGNATDTTISRSAAGIIAVEGIDQVNLSSSQTLTNKTISGSSNTLSNISFGSMTFAGVRVTQSAGQSITASTLTALNFDTEAYDTDTMHDNVTNNSRITFTTAGRYNICAAVTTDANAVIYGGIRLNGTTYIAKSGVGNAGANTANGINLSTTYNFSAGDYVELMGTFGTTQNTKSGVDGCFITANRVG